VARKARHLLTPEQLEAQRAKDRAWKKLHPRTAEQRAAKKLFDRERYLATREKKLAQAKAYREQNKEAALTRSAKYYAAHKEESRAKSKIWRQNNQEIILKNRRKYYANNREKVLAVNKTVQHRYVMMCRRDREKGRPTMSFEEYQSLEGTVCHYCGDPRPPAGCGLDRKDNTGGHVIENVVPSCRPCNVAHMDHFSFEEMETEIGPAIRRVKERRRALAQASVAA
jgi:flagellar biosynthesis GTPase FlhF